MYSLTKGPSIDELSSMWKSQSVDLSYLINKKITRPFNNHLHHWLSKLLFERVLLYFIGGKIKRFKNNVKLLKR
jgi:hypothetical protein